MAAVVAYPQDTPADALTLNDIEDKLVQAERISAYYSLVFPNFTYYLQTLNVTIGRRCIPASTASSSDNPQVDVDLGPLKSVSRLHARIEYDEEEERFVLVVVGRNGAWVDGVWSGAGSRVALGDRCVVYSIPFVCSAHTAQVPNSDRVSYFSLHPSASSTARGFTLTEFPFLHRQQTTLTLC